mmetsp:Transcript_9833/g.11301  ORF Transcript_9833/g.11301 Transcript_9833/m.11301 type:complete len:189 (+) Transcript_9833:48-614(+)
MSSSKPRSSTKNFMWTAIHRFLICMAIISPLSTSAGIFGTSKKNVGHAGKYDIPNLPYSLGIRDSIMIAHSFRNNTAFGPAQNLHGATYTVDVTFKSAKLHTRHNWVIDIGKASTTLSSILSKYNLQNLDELFDESIMTTTEFMCRKIFDDIQRTLETEYPGEFNGVVHVKLWESHKAWASFEGCVGL